MVLLVFLGAFPVNQRKRFSGPRMSSNPQSSETQAGKAVPLRAPMEAVISKVVHFEDLARCGNEVWIENNGQLYRLQKTKQGKLILTK